MARIDNTAIDNTAYKAIREGSTCAPGEHNDCAVVAVAAACGVTYDAAHAMLAKVGRKNRHGTYPRHTHAAVFQFGFTLTRVSAFDFISRYPKAHQVLRSVTTHHPDRFKSVWQDGETYIIHTRSHVLAVRNGVNVDWTRGRAKRAVDIYRVTKNPA